jgi:hypothetical protein
VNDLGYSNPEVAAQFVLALPATQQRNSMHQVVNSFARLDRPAAIEWANRLTSAEARASALRNIVQQWAFDDPKGAAAFCVGNALGTPDVVGSAVANWADNDLREALAWASALPAGPNHDAAFTSAVSVLARTNPYEAAELAATIAGREKKGSAFGGIASTWAQKDPSAAANWAAQLTDPSARGNALSNVASVWARNDPASAALWASRLPNNVSILSTISGEWARNDATGAATWLDTLPSGSARDHAVMSFSQAIVGADPGSASAWAESISDPGQRQNAVNQVFYQWKQSDPAAATAWLQATSAVPEDARRRMLHQGE